MPANRQDFGDSGAADQAGMQALDLGGAEHVSADLEHGAMQTDRCSLFHGKADGGNGRMEVTRTLCERGHDVAAEEEFTRRVQDLGIHDGLSAGQQAGALSALGALEREIRRIIQCTDCLALMAVVATFHRQATKR